MNIDTDIVRLIRKKKEGTISDQELLFLKTWTDESSFHAELLKKAEDDAMVLEDVSNWLTLKEEDINEEWNLRLESGVLSKICSEKEQIIPRKTTTLWRFIPYAAILLLATTFTFIAYRYILSTDDQVEIQDLNPGINKAHITLSDGSIIELRSDQTGVVLGEELTYEDGTHIAQLADEKIAYATIQTPKGGQYQITLSDGTKVWLNAETKLTYPSIFTGEARIVELEGEAYFDVETLNRQGERIPFMVKTAQQQVEVLGTQFNIKAYPDEAEKNQTTLVEGAVQLHLSGKTLLLQPGEQGISNASGLSKKKVNVDQYVAWKNNEFVFDETELKDALKMLSRWYDFEVSLKNNFPTTHLYGSISRKKNLTEVLKIMESSGLTFRIERTNNKNKLIYYMNNKLDNTMK